MRVDDILDRHSGKVFALLGNDDAVQDCALKYETEIFDGHLRDDAGLLSLGELTSNMRVVLSDLALEEPLIAIRILPGRPVDQGFLVMDAWNLGRCERKLDDCLHAASELFSRVVRIARNAQCMMKLLKFLKPRVECRIPQILLRSEVMGN